jgi:hypothetical protein
MWLVLHAGLPGRRFCGWERDVAVAGRADSRLSGGEAVVVAVPPHLWQVLFLLLPGLLLLLLLLLLLIKGVLLPGRRLRVRLLLSGVQQGGPQHPLLRPLVMLLRLLACCTLCSWPPLLQQARVRQGAW